MIGYSQPYHIYWDREGFYVADAEGRDITPTIRFQRMLEAEKHLNELEVDDMLAAYYEDAIKDEAAR